MGVARRWIVWPATLLLLTAGCNDSARPVSGGGGGTVGTNSTQDNCTRCHG